MGNETLTDIQKFFQDRRALLWVCQRYDLSTGEVPHQYDLPETEAALRYRKEPTQLDNILTNLYWEAIWLEGARSPLLTCLRKRDREEPSTPRKLVVLASEADARADLNTTDFIPVFCLPGLIDDSQSLPLGNRYDPSRKRSRERIAWDLGSRLIEYSRRLLVVIGVKTENDLQRLFEILSERPILDLTVLIILPEEMPEPQQVENTGVRLIIQRGTIESFVNTLLALKAPKAGELSEWAIRLGKHTVKLSERDVSRIRESFAILTEKMLISPDHFTMDDLHAFFTGNLANWKAYAENDGLPVERSYRSETNESLFKVVIRALKEAADTDLASFFHVRLPCETGSGATTLIRQVAFYVASEGFPTLVFRQNRLSLDPEEVIAFATALVEKYLDQGGAQSAVFFLVFDVEHESLTPIRKLGQMMAGAGRNVVILQVVRPLQEDKGPIKGKYGRLLPVFQADATPEEITQCREVLTKIVSRWNLDLNVPDQVAWNTFVDSTKFIGHAGEDEDTGSKFWVALWFFLTKEMDFLTGERFRDALGRWIQKRCLLITSELVLNVIKHVAVLSSFRLASPLWTVLRPATGGAFSSELPITLKQMEGIVEWGPLQKSHQDQTLRFVHPTVAKEFLRQRGVSGDKNRLSELRPVLENLSTGHAADVWLAEAIVTEVVAPKFEERIYSDWEWRINTFEIIPQQLSNQSKTILHHWARCLYQSVDERYFPDIPVEERQKCFRKSIELLRKALDLPQRLDRDEHPSHLYNTLATAYYRVARMLESTPSPGESAQEAWEQCCNYFEESLHLSGRTNVEALLAFAKRRIEHWERATGTLQEVTPDRVEEIADALNLLDEAEEVMTNLPSPEPGWEVELNKTRTRVLKALNEAQARDFVEKLKCSSKPELGYFCHAQLLLSDKEEATSVENALQLLLKARDDGVQLGHRSLHLLLSLLRRHHQRQFDFALLRQLYLDLEKLPGYTTRPIDQFWHAVTCYQLGEYSEGAERFAKLREQSKVLDNYRLRVRAIWRDKNNPNLPKETVARVNRIFSDFRAEGFLEEIGQKVYLRPRHWRPMPKINEPIRCVIRFEANGPLAVPSRFEINAVK